MNYLNALWEYFVDKSLIQGIVLGLFFYVIGFIRGVNYGFFAVPLLRRFKALIIRRKYILVWNDHNVETSEKIIALLKLRCPKYRYKVLKNGESLLQYPMKTDAIHMVMLIVTDVTKLSDVEKRRVKIQKRLIKYVSAGGLLFGTHDIIYRRCRNKELEELYGCEICNFQRVHHPIPVHILPQYKTHPLLSGLPDSFKLDDNEVCWGEWSNDATILVQTDDKFRNNIHNKLEYVPTLVIRHTGNIGTLIWLNCADKTDKLPASLHEPQMEVTKIMANAINLQQEIKDYYIANH